MGLFGCYLLIINIVAFATYGIDKRNAVRGRWRTKEVTLLGLAAVGGSIGAIAAMHTFRHKTRKPLFAIGVPLIILVQAALIYCVLGM